MHKCLWWGVSIVRKWGHLVRRRIVTVDGFAYLEDGRLELGRGHLRWGRGMSLVNPSALRIATIVTPRIAIRTTSPSPTVASPVVWPIASTPLPIIGFWAFAVSFSILTRGLGIRCSVGGSIRPRSKAVTIIPYFKRIRIIRVSVAW